MDAELSAGPSTREVLVNVALYQIGWFACVLGAARGWGTAGASVAVALTALHVLLSTHRRGEITLIATAGLLGLAVETLQLKLGVLVFPDRAPGATLPPAWILALWLQFATLFNFAFAWLAGRKLLAAALGLVGGPLAFLAGERLGAAVIGEPRWQSLAILAGVWALAVPALVALADASPAPGRYRPARGPVG